ncbi:hypothetical protein [Paenibacillus rhizophilus]|uniref:Uncharacterized protein n=1 Tax=Paenibacillus rhizophilus TaxID=1850366 RepID=A0A3N9P2A4_9BACL|nr:hypothetical protein [Paenibacillus rhizophilus]RQW09935.1 hypothetical protein EH198_17800 [Paenibacillus rhizophilus]
MDIDNYIQQIKTLRAEADLLEEDAPGAVMRKINLLTHAHMLMGRVSAHMDGDYAKVYAYRKIKYAQAQAEAKKGQKGYAGELAVADLRMAEAQAQALKTFWNNEFRSLREYIYELRLRVRVDMNTLGGGD